MYVIAEELSCCSAFSWSVEVGEYKFLPRIHKDIVPVFELMKLHLGYLFFHSCFLRNG